MSRCFKIIVTKLTIVGERLLLETQRASGVLLDYLDHTNKLTPPQQVGQWYPLFSFVFS